MRFRERSSYILFAVALIFIVATTANAEFVQQGSKLVGTGAVGAAFQGASVSLSADGNTAIVGGPLDDNSGAAWVFTRANGVWSQQGSKLVGTGATGGTQPQQGISVSLSADGNTAIAGGHYDNAGLGAAWVFTRANGVWSQQGDKLVGTGIEGAYGASQGFSVSLSADGNTAIVGGYADDNFAGAAWVFTRANGVWSQQGSKLVGTGAVGTAGQGVSVSLSADGNTAIVGGDGDNNSTGAAWVFTRANGVWSQQGSKLVGTDAVGAALQGRSVSLSADGNTAIVGGYLDDNGAGAAWVFTRANGVWSQQGSKLIGTGASGAADQGYSVSLSADGNTAIVGGPWDNYVAGAAWVYVLEPSYSFTGFLPPVGNPPVVNSAKAGQAIPVKWQLTDGGGSYISDLSVVVSVTFQQVQCSDLSTSLTNEVTTTTSGGSGLHYDATANQFIYNWKTDMSMSGSCYMLILRLNDGSEYHAYFSLK